MLMTTRHAEAAYEAALPKTLTVTWKGWALEVRTRTNAVVEALLVDDKADCTLCGRFEDCECPIDGAGFLAARTADERAEIQQLIDEANDDADEGARTAAEVAETEAGLRGWL